MARLLWNHRIWRVLRLWRWLRLPAPVREATGSVGEYRYYFTTDTMFGTWTQKVFR